MKKNIKNFLIYTLLISFFITPSLSVAQQTQNAFDLQEMSISSVGSDSAKIFVKKIPENGQIVSFDLADEKNPKIYSINIDLKTENPVLFDKLTPNTKYTVTAHIPGLVLSNNTLSFTTRQKTADLPLITAVSSGVTSEEALITITVEKIDPSLLPLNLSLAYGKSGEAVKFIEINTDRLNLFKKTPESFEIKLNYFGDDIVPNTTYSYRVVQTGSHAPYTDIYTFKTLKEEVVNVITSDQPKNNNTAKDKSSNTSTKTDNTGLVTCRENCGWNDLLATINKVVNFVIFRLVIPIAAIMFAYAGFELIASGGSSEKKEKAKGVFINVVIGIVFAAAAWLIIHTISSILGYNGSWIGF